MVQNPFDCILIFWTGHQRDSSLVSTEQQANTSANMASLLRMREHAVELQKQSSNGGLDIAKFGKKTLSHESWNLNGQLASKISIQRPLSGT